MTTESTSGSGRQADPAPMSDSGRQADPAPMSDSGRQADPAPMLFPCSHGADDPERATIPFIAAATAAVSGHRAIVVCSVDAVWSGTPGHAETIEAEGLPPLEDLVRQLIDHGGEIWLCSACTTRRGITGDDVRDGATIVGAATIVDALATGKAITLA